MNSSNRKTVVGQVVSNKMDKSIVVRVNRRIKHPVYGKFIIKSANYSVHDENNECSIGDTVRIAESKPISKSKRWRLVEVVSKVEII